MIDKELQFIERVTTRMMDDFLQALHSKEFEEVFSDHYSCVVKSVISSFTATMLHNWCSTVANGDESYRNSFVNMVSEIFNNVMVTMDAKDQMKSNEKREVH